jgi:hypothetical protein
VRWCWGWEGGFTRVVMMLRVRGIECESRGNMCECIRGSGWRVDGMFEIARISIVWCMLLF